MSKCTITKQFVTPCDALKKATDFAPIPSGKTRGIFRNDLVDENFEPVRTIFGVKTDEFKRGLAFNFCPWCGTDLTPVHPRYAPLPEEGSQA